MCTVFSRHYLTFAIFYSQQLTGRYFSSAGSGKEPGFFAKLLDNVKNEFSKNKEMSENISKFREEAKKLEESEALKDARRKFEIVESEASKSSEVLKDSFESVKGKLTEAVKEAKTHEFVKKAGMYICHCTFGAGFSIHFSCVNPLITLELSSKLHCFYDHR